jgi:hypothetical protein
VEELDRARADARHAQHLEQAVRHLVAQPLVVLERAGLRQLGQLGRKGRAGAGQLRRRPAAIE